MCNNLNYQGLSALTQREPCTSGWIRMQLVESIEKKRQCTAWAHVITHARYTHYLSVQRQAPIIYQHTDIHSWRLIILDKLRYKNNIRLLACIETGLKGLDSSFWGVWWGAGKALHAACSVFCLFPFSGYLLQFGTIPCCWETCWHSHVLCY